jgi:hypothetical protein
MTSKSRVARKNADSEIKELEALYLELVKQFYDRGDRARAKKAALLLEKLLSTSPKFAESIRGEEVRSLIAELHGNLPQAIQSRQAEIRKILALHELTVRTPRWKYVSRQYDFSDVSDRYDLLATLYDELGELDSAIAVLKESKRYCEDHKIPFDGQELLEKLQEPEKENSTSEKE